MSMDEWRQRVIDGHRLSVLKGEHDDECEFRENGHFLCNCGMRARVASGFTEPPTLWISYPVCSHCHEQVGYDGDSLTCDTCHVTWSNAAEDVPGTFSDDYGVLDMIAWDTSHSLEVRS